MKKKTMVMTIRVVALAIGSLVLILKLGACVSRPGPTPISPVAPTLEAQAPAPSLPVVEAGGERAEVGDASFTPTQAEASLALTTGSGLVYRGVNLSGAEFGTVPGVLGRDYGYPTQADVDYFVARGAKHVRLPFRHERLQRALRAELDPAEWARLEAIVTYIASKGLSVAIEPHNSARFNGRVITDLEMGDFWGRVAKASLGKPYTPRLMLNLTNEPHDMTTEVWLGLAKAAVKEIRRVGFTGKVLVPGNGWTGAMHWTSKWYGTSNSVLMQQVVDSNLAFEVHLYLDTDGSGGGRECVSAQVGVERLKGFVAWLKAQGRVGYLGEIGAPNTPTCALAVKNTLTYVESEPAVWIGWAWWSAGSRWRPDYQLSIQPLVTDAGLSERPQLEWLLPFWRSQGCP